MLALRGKSFEQLICLVLLEVELRFMHWCLIVHHQDLHLRHLYFETLFTLLVQASKEIVFFDLYLCELGYLVHECLVHDDLLSRLLDDSIEFKLARTEP